MATSSGRVTLAIVATELKNLSQAVNRLNEKFDPLVITVDRLDQKEQARVWQFRAIWTTLSAGAVAFVINLFRTQ